VTDKSHGRRKYLQRGGRRRFHNKIGDMEIMIDSPATTWWRTVVYGFSAMKTQTIYAVDGCPPV
jgi:hypothetical protein